MIRVNRNLIEMPRKMSIFLFYLMIIGASAVYIIHEWDESDRLREFQDAIKDLFTGDRKVCDRKWPLTTANLTDIHKEVQFKCYYKPFGSPVSGPLRTWIFDPSIRNKMNHFSKPINFLIHGWKSSSDEEWMSGTAKKWSESCECSVCMVDWKDKASNDNYYSVALDDTPKIANAVKSFIQFLKVCKSVDIQNVSIAGHSLGAHIAGMVGGAFPEKIRAIYGLDPAGPIITDFVIVGSVPLDKRLDKSDAKYVQCVHTAYASFGTLKDCGHGDFYMNNGRRQPACTTGDAICYHGMAHEYFAESMLPNHIFEGPHCPEGKIESFAKEWMFARGLLPIVDNWLRDNCDQSRIDRLGIYAAKNEGRFFVPTNENYPYAKRIT